MKKLFFTTLLSILSVSIFSQTIEQLFSMFASDGCSKLEVLDEDEWKFAKYVFSRIDPLFYDMDRTEQIKDSVNSTWFNKVFTYNDNGYSLDFEKVKAEASKVNHTDIPQVNEFIFIGMKMPILEKAKSISSLEMNNCNIELKDKFWQEIEAIKPFYEILVGQQSDKDKNLIMKSKQEEPFPEIIIAAQNDDSSINLLRLQGTFHLSDITPSEEYNE